MSTPTQAGEFWAKNHTSGQKWSASYADGWGTFSSPCWLEVGAFRQQGWWRAMKAAVAHGLQEGCTVTVRLAEEQLANLAGGPLFAANTAHNAERQAGR